MSTEHRGRSTILRWLPMLVLAWIAATWLAETRLQRLEISDTNLVPEGDFSEGLPGGPNWEYAGSGADLWQAAGGVEGGAALRLGGGPIVPLLRYRLPMAYRADGYFIGICLRGGEDGAGARVRMRRADLPQLPGLVTVLDEASGTDQWRCDLRSVMVPPGVDELAIEVFTPPGSGTLWVDRLALHPAVSPPLYRLVHTVLAFGWVALGVVALGTVWSVLGGVTGVLTLGSAVAALALAVLGVEGWLRDPWSGALEGLAARVAELAGPVSEVVRLLTGERAAGGPPDIPGAAGLLVTGFVAAWAVMLRFRWVSRPWGRVLGYAGLFGLSVQAVRLLLHVPGFTYLDWVLGPAGALAGVAVGAVLAEPVLRPRRLPDD